MFGGSKNGGGLMARRTKEDAMATRDSLLDAAELLFLEQGVSRTTLQHIATAAGVTRGAIYWHFADKAALFYAMMERAKMPLERAMEMIGQDPQSDPVSELRDMVLCVLRVTAGDPKTRRVFEIATFKLELVDEMASVRERRLEGKGKWIALAEDRIKAGIRHGQLREGLPVRAVALGLYALLDGLMRSWLLNPNGFNLVKMGQQILDLHLDSLRA
jgi:TetR/AcrR family acrAB operon transcriptional repressor